MALIIGSDRWWWWYCWRWFSSSKWSAWRLNQRSSYFRNRERGGKKIKDCHPVNTSLLFLQPSVRFPMVETPIPVLPAAGQGRSSGWFIIDQAPLSRVLISLCWRVRCGHMRREPAKYKPAPGPLCWGHRTKTLAKVNPTSSEEAF